MKKYKIILSISILVCTLIFVIGCSKRDEESKNSISQDKLEKLPDYQKDDEINKELVKLREERKKNNKEDSTGLYSGTTFAEGERIDIPVSDDEIENIVKVAENYVRNTLNISENSDLEGPTGCIDNRMLNIYKDDDKGVASGYANENIYIEEYEYKEGKYKYLIIARKDKNSSWEVIHDGLSYKK